MRYLKFQISNFRGIKSLELEFPKPASIITLVGLNESGKTTILEAINHFTFNPESLDALSIKGYGIKDPHTLIPISKKANFNGITSIDVDVEFEKSDIAAIRKFAIENLDAKEIRCSTRFTMSQRTAFTNSRHDQSKSNHHWTVRFDVQKADSSLFAPVDGEEWTKAVAFMRTLLPPIIYFPTFTLDIPEKIYLDNPPSEPRKHEFYRQVLQDVLDSLDLDANVQTHIAQRLLSVDPNDKSALDGVLLDMGRSITKSVFTAWNRIFHKRPAAKRVVLNAGVDPESRPYIQFKIEDADGYFLLSERSVGFRWFFSFLLLTQFRVFRKGAVKNALFLFDEPASNLHPTAQARLLESFPILLDAGTVVYTTHSQHLINVDWLGEAFVVKNEGASEAVDDIDTSSLDTSISATRYSRFVNDHPDQTFFFKPILDVLDYAPARLEGVRPAVLVEGRSDLFAIRLFGRSGSEEFDLMPGMGAGSLDSLISLYAGWGRKFIVLLDSDAEGAKQKARYTAKFGSLLDGRIFTLGDLLGSTRPVEIEDLVSQDDKEVLRHAYFADSAKLTKKAFLSAIQQSLVSKSPIQFSADTRSTFAALNSALGAKLSAL